jgi:hypothetical protein
MKPRVFSPLVLSQRQGKQHLELKSYYFYQKNNKMRKKVEMMVNKGREINMHLASHINLGVLV